MQLGFIGLGNMGLSIAQHWAVPEHALSVYDLVPAGPAEMKERGARIARSPAEVARNADLIGVCVRDDEDVREVMEGPHGILSAAQPGLLVAIHSTVRVATVREVADRASERGVRVVDAAVTRSFAEPGARSLIFMLGGEPADVERAEPILALSALEVVKTGALGTGMALKLCNNLLTYLTVVCGKDAINLAEAAGLDVGLLADVTASNGVAGTTLTYVLSNRAGRAGPAIDEVPSPTMTADIAEKDLDNVLDAGAELNVALPAVELARREFRKALLHIHREPR